MTNALDERTDWRTLNDLVDFARLEVEAGDVEPWADVLGELYVRGDLDREAALWAVKLYNAYDDLGSAWRVAARWPGPATWAIATDHTLAAQQPIPHERRNLRGGRIVRHLDSYADTLAGQSQWQWLTEALPVAADPHDGFGCLMPYLRRVWGVGRQTAFEWAEFTAKVVGLPVETTDGCLWESSGPRESIERLYGGFGTPEPWLNRRAGECRAMLAEAGVDLSWWDFETVICDFNVMRKGRYYPGKHLAMISSEIGGMDEPGRSAVRSAYQAVIPAPWRDIPPGADKALAAAYRDTGTIHTPIGDRP